MQHFGDFPVQWNKQKISKNTTFLLKTKSKPVKKTSKFSYFLALSKMANEYSPETFLSNTFQVTLGICNLFTCCSVKAV